MSDFLIYAARLQDAGVVRLSVNIWTAADGTRMMRVTPHGSYPMAVHARWPWRDFELCGTDRVLEATKDGLLYGVGGATAEKVQAAIDAHPILRDDLNEWFADHLLMSASCDEPEPESTPEDEAAGKRMADKVKAIMQGMDIARRRNAMKAA